MVSVIVLYRLRLLASSKKGFRVLEHTADEYIMAYGSDLGEAFESAALAMFEVMTNIKTVKPRNEGHVEVEAGDEAALLYAWLESLLVRFSVEGKLYSKFRVDNIERRNETLYLKATIWGEEFAPKRHTSRTDVKAVTYDRMEILREKDRVVVKFVLDV